MLVELHAVNFALMEDVRLQLGPGLSVFTGETGAGKSMLIDAIGVLLGGRASAEFVRHGAEQARVEGVFESLPAGVVQLLAEAGYPAEDDQLVLFREINLSGRNLCRVQGRTVPLSLYRTLCTGLVDIHGQMEHQSLLAAATQRRLLDGLGGIEQVELAAKVDAVARSYQALCQKERDLTVSERERQRQEEMFRYQIAEIDEVHPVPGEEETLAQEKRRLTNAERLLNLASAGYNYLYGGEGTPSVYDLVSQARKNLQEFVRLEAGYTALVEQLDMVYYTIEDMSDQLRNYRENFELEPGRLDQIEERLVRLHRLRKYGTTVEEILNYRAEIEQQLHQITHLQEEMTALHNQKADLIRRYTTFAADLTAQREIQAGRLEQGLSIVLGELGMERSRMEVRLLPKHEPAVGGAEEVEFYFSANPGEPPRPLAKVASGGEMARLMLAFKSLLAEVEEVSTFVFDEVDSGVGGRISQKVGEKLARISEFRQVLCITHAAQVAAFADEHFGISKEVQDGRTYTRVAKLNAGTRLAELARMLGDAAGDITRRHAEELWRTASGTKQQSQR